MPFFPITKTPKHLPNDITTPRGGIYRKGETPIGQGTTDVAVSYTPRDSGSPMSYIVLTPIDPDENNFNTLQEAKRKLHFFMTLYSPPYPASCFELTHQPSDYDYMLRIPKLPGQSIEQCIRAGTLSRIPLKDLFIAICKAIENAHEKGLVILDIKSDNILLCEEENAPISCLLIDGGVSCRQSSPIPGNFKRHPKDIPEAQAKCHQIAPECWYSNDAPLATPEMDIYALGYLFKYICNHLMVKPPEALRDIIDACWIEALHNPDDRADMPWILEHLNFLPDWTPPEQTPTYAAR